MNERFIAVSTVTGYVVSLLSRDRIKDASPWGS